MRRSRNSRGYATARGVIVMPLQGHGEVYGPYENILVIFNATLQQVTFADGRGEKSGSHPVLTRYAAFRG